MAKDPAFLFYTNDFLSGTQFFTDEQVGKYLRLLMAQHQHGHLSEKQVLFICKTFDSDIMEKFIKDDAGFYFNSKLEKLINERISFSESRRNNRLGKTKKQVKKKSKTSDSHKEDEIEDENKEQNKLKGVPEKDVFVKYGLEITKNEHYTYSIAAKYEQWLADGWRDGNKKKITNWKTKLQNTIPHLKPFTTGTHQDPLTQDVNSAWEFIENGTN